MWLIVGNWIVERRIDKGITDLSTGKYDPVIREATIKAVNSILEDKSLRKEVTNMLNGYATAFSKMAIERFINAIQEQFGIDVSDMAKQYGGGGGGLPFNPEKIVGRILDSVFPE